MKFEPNPLFSQEEYLNNLHDLFDKSKVTERGGTYNSKSKSISLNKSIRLDSISSDLNQKENRQQKMRFSQNFSSSLGFDKGSNKIFLASQMRDESKTNIKVPIFRQEEAVPAIQRKHSQVRHSLFNIQINKRQSNQYSPQNYPILRIFLKQKILQPIQEEQPNRFQRGSGSSIDTNICLSQRESNSTDISFQ